MIVRLLFFALISLTVVKCLCVVCVCIVVSVHEIHFVDRTCVSCFFSGGGDEVKVLPGLFSVTVSHDVLSVVDLALLSSYEFVMS